VIEASYLALVDAFNYALLRHRGLLTAAAAAEAKAEIPATI
jgi:hypothetical protein